MKKHSQRAQRVGDQIQRELGDLLRLHLKDPRIGMLSGSGSNAAKRAAWLEFARWLVAGLTFQLAADIVNTTIAPTWDEIGRLAAIAAIRTFLTLFLDRDIDSMRGSKHNLERRPDDARHI